MVKYGPFTFYKVVQVPAMSVNTKRILTDVTMHRGFLENLYRVRQVDSFWFSDSCLSTLQPYSSYTIIQSANCFFVCKLSFDVLQMSLLELCAVSKV